MSRMPHPKLTHSSILNHPQVSPCLRTVVKLPHSDRRYFESQLHLLSGDDVYHGPATGLLVSILAQHRIGELASGSTAPWRIDIRIFDQSGLRHLSRRWTPARVC